MKTKQLYLGLLVIVKDRLFRKSNDATYTIEELLARSNKESLSLNESDRAWLNEKSVGKEII